MDGKISDKAAPPFATSGGKPVNPSGSNKGGGRDFLTDPAGGSNKGGGRDFTKESRPQTDAKPEVVPSKGEIPEGGKDLMADPGPVSKMVSGSAMGIDGGPKPFKGLK